jgi:hypothetical protein
MRILKIAMMAAVAGVFSLGGTGVAQAQEVPGLTQAIANGDTAAINAIIAANQGNATVLAQIANQLFAAAQGIQFTNPTVAALLAAMALNTGALTGNNAVIALNLVASNPTALALLTNPNAPNTGGNPFGPGGNNFVPGGSQTNNPAQNQAQNTSQN